MHDKHQGKAVRQKVKESGMKVTDFAKAIHRGRRAVYHIFDREIIDNVLLKQISDVLGPDFTPHTNQPNTTIKKYLAIVETDEEQLRDITLKFKVVFLHECVQ